MKGKEKSIGLQWVVKLLAHSNTFGFFFFFNLSFTSPSPTFQHYLVLVLVLNDGNHLAKLFRRRGVTFKKLDMFIMFSGGLWTPHWGMHANYFCQPLNMCFELLTIEINIASSWLKEMFRLCFKSFELLLQVNSFEPRNTRGSQN